MCNNTKLNGKLWGKYVKPFNFSAFYQNKRETSARERMQINYGPSSNTPFHEGKKVWKAVHKIEN